MNQLLSTTKPKQAPTTNSRRNMSQTYDESLFILPACRSTSRFLIKFSKMFKTAYDNRFINNSKFGFGLCLCVV